MAKKRNGVTHTAMTEISDDQMLILIDRAEKHVAKQGWSYDEFDRQELLYKTAFYLYSVDKLLKQQRTFPCYVVHSADDESRFETGSFDVAFRQYKRMARDGRVALFHWPDKLTQKKMYASDAYPYSKDFGPKED